MDTEKLKEHLKTLTEMHGPSGHESPIREYLRDYWSDLVDEFEVDGLGNLIGIKRGSGAGPRKKIMLCAHMDEIAYMVKEVRDGYINLHSIWGADSRINLGKIVIVHANGHKLPGVVGAVPPHISQYTNSRKKYTPLDEQWVDLGMPADEVDSLVNVGDLVTMEAPLLELSNDRVAGKAMDDRASVASVTAALEHLQTREHVWDVYAVASVQEEVGLRGAQTAAYHVHPHVAIAIDVTFAQQPGMTGDEYPKLGDSPVIDMGPNFHPALFDSIVEVAKRLEMKVFEQVSPGRSGTDAWAIQISHEGIPTALLNIPARNVHSTVETVSLKDIDRTGRLMGEFIAGLAEDYLETLQWKLEDKESTE
jgi:putative aminopeptidase FrvX